MPSLLPWLLMVAPFIGSFLGTLILRLPRRQPVLITRSACPHCAASLGAADLVPLLSWLLQRGRCRHCGGAVPPFYPAVELAAVAAVAWAALETTGEPLLASCLLGWGLLALAVTDRREFLLPDALTLPLLLLGLAITAWLDLPALAGHAAGAGAGWLGFAGVAALYRRLRGRDGLGAGDAKLLAAGGAWLGWESLPEVILVASLLGVGEVLVRAGLRRDAPAASERVAFGTWLAAAIWLAWLYGPILPG